MSFANQANPDIALVVMPTGTGKSGVVAPYALNSSRVLIITPSVFISTQLYRDMCGTTAESTFYVRRNICTIENVVKFAENGYLVDKSLLRGGKTMDHFVRTMKLHNLVIANAHKFGENTGFDIAALPRTLFDTVIVDEAHHYPARTWTQIIDYFNLSKKVFVTATPTHRGQQIVGTSLEDQTERFIAYQLGRDDAVVAGMIRSLNFQEVGNHDDNDEQRIRVVAGAVLNQLQVHDMTDQAFIHKAMIICFTIDDLSQVVDTINELLFCVFSYGCLRFLQILPPKFKKRRVRNLAQRIATRIVC
ncbi:hypothetical protein EON63_14180 [archaeon]|nr:MAG: hypothetical protein EON63_14180 [archaeon]